MYAVCSIKNKEKGRKWKRRRTDDGKIKSWETQKLLPICQ